MKVKELIEKLAKCNQDFNIIMPDECDLVDIREWDGEVWLVDTTDDFPDGSSDFE